MGFSLHRDYPRAASTVICLFAVSVLVTGVRAAPPDLTAAGVIASIDRKATYNLGATGLRGWISTKAADDLDAAQGRTTLASRQILVTHVGAASPADGVVKVDDVILGVGGKPFSDDARKSIASAIQEAETGAKGGELNNQRVNAVEHAIRSIEAATTQPELRSIGR